MEKIVVVLIILTALEFSLCIPNIYYSLGFDAQNVSTWKYAENLGLLPYKDVFYPYGLLSYFQGANIVWRLVYAAEILVLLYFYVILFKKLFKNQNFAYLSFFYFYAVVILHTGLYAFARYGVITTFAIILSLELFKTIYLARLKIIFFGIISGIIFYLWTDQGIYILIITIFFIIVNPWIKNGLKELIKKKYYVDVSISFALYLSGITIGLIPLLMYLVVNNSLGDFLLSIKRLGDISFFAKTPFFHSLRYLIPSLNFAALFISISYLSIRYFFYQKKKLIRLATYLSR